MAGLRKTNECGPRKADGHGRARQSPIPARRAGRAPVATPNRLCDAIRIAPSAAPVRERPKSNSPKLRPGSSTPRSANTGQLRGRNGRPRATSRHAHGDRGREELDPEQVEGREFAQRHLRQDRRCCPRCRGDDRQRERHRACHRRTRDRPLGPADDAAARIRSLVEHREVLEQVPVRVAKVDGCGRHPADDARLVRLLCMEGERSDAEPSSVDRVRRERRRATHANAMWRVRAIGADPAAHSPSIARPMAPIQKKAAPRVSVRAGRAGDRRCRGRSRSSVEVAHRQVRLEQAVDGDRLAHGAVVAPDVRERVVEGIECLIGRYGRTQRCLGCEVPDLDAGAVVGRVPVERDLEAAADAVRELTMPVDDGRGRHGHGSFVASASTLSISGG